MKFLIISFALVAAASAADEKRYLGYPGAPNGYTDIQYSTSELIPGKSYSYSYGTGNGIHVREDGVFTYPGSTKEPVLNVNGGYRYTGPRGEVVIVTYKAGPEGFIPQVKIHYPGYGPDANRPSIPSKPTWGDQGNYFGPWLRDASAPSDTVEST